MKQHSLSNFEFNRAVMFGIAGIDINMLLPSPSIKKRQKCLLKDCNKTTTHNGGYCCAEHCKLDRLDRSHGKNNRQSRRKAERGMEDQA